MNKVSLTMLFVGVLLSSSPILSNSKYQSTLHELWEGIKDSKPYLVEEALHNKVNLNVRFGPYNDTPLMMALRVYGRHLQDRMFFAPMQKTSSGRKIMFSLIPSLVLTFACSYLTSHKYKLGLLFTVSYGTILTFLSFPTAHSSPAKVVDLLIRAELNINARNKEGLTALDILRSYYSYAYQLQDEAWYKFLALLIFKSGKDNAHDAWGDIEEDIEKYRSSASDN